MLYLSEKPLATAKGVRGEVSCDGLLLSEIWYYDSVILKAY